MRHKRNETPKPGARNGNRISPINVREKLDLSDSSKLDGRDKALAALAMMKELERKNRGKMMSASPDRRTLLASNKKANLERMVKEYSNPKRAI